MQLGAMSEENGGPVELKSLKTVVVAFLAVCLVWLIHCICLYTPESVCVSTTNMYTSDDQYMLSIMGCHWNEMLLKHC